MSELQAIVDKLTEAAKGISNQLLLPLTGALVVAVLIWGGFQYTQGNAEAGKKTITAAVIGLVIVALASLIIHLANDALQRRLPMG